MSAILKKMKPLTICHMRNQKYFCEKSSFKVAILQKVTNEGQLKLNQNLILDPETEISKNSTTREGKVCQAQPSIASLIAVAINNFRYTKASEDL